MAAIEIGLLVLPRVRRLDLTGRYEVFASWPQARARLFAKARESVTSSSGFALTPTMASGLSATRRDLRSRRVGVNAPMGGEENLVFPLRAGEGRALRGVGALRTRGGLGAGVDFALTLVAELAGPDVAKAM